MARFYGSTRRVLLVDHNPEKQRLRATILRNHDLEVHVAASVGDAERLCISHVYDLILLAAAEDSAEALTLSRQIRKRKPRQRIALLVGAPTYIRELGEMPARLSKENLLPTNWFISNVIDSTPPSQRQEITQRLMSRPA
jgi:CheY-like chemotaxis protein